MWQPPQKCVFARCNLLLHCPLMFSWKHPPHSKLGFSETWREMTQCNQISCQSCCGWPVLLRSSVLWVCSACWPSSLKDDASPVAPCGQTEHTRPLWHSCVPGESFSCSTVSTESGATSAPKCWETGTCSVLLYSDSESTAHFNLSGFYSERKRGKITRIHIQQSYHSLKISGK